MPAYGFDMDAVVSVHQLVSNAITLDGQTTDHAEQYDGEETERVSRL
jgi:hypothetical protein